ncbi:hypothetical protein COBT_001842 [Conglomerata obtusa]
MQPQSMNKLLDPEILLQKDLLKKCEQAFTTHEKRTHRILKNLILSQAYTETIQTFTQKTIEIFDKRGFIDCFEEIADHKAMKVLCQDFYRQYFDYDLIEKAAIIEYEKCIAKKNKALLRKVLVLIPETLKDDVDNLSDIILNHKK